MKKPYELHEKEYLRMAEQGVGAWDQRPWAAPDAGAPEVHPSTLEILSQILRNPWAPRAGKVLELGCGTAPILRWICRQGDFTGHGIDVSKTAIAMAEAKSADLPLTFEQADLCRLSARHPGYDLIIDGHCLHCLTDARDRRRFLRTVRQLLAPAGVFILMSMCAPLDLDAFQKNYPNQVFRDNIIYVPYSRSEAYAGVISIGESRYLPTRHIGDWHDLLRGLERAELEIKFALYNGASAESPVGELVAACSPAEKKLNAKR